jgi:hypothetical protein
MVQKMVEKLCPMEDPIERFALRKGKLDELCDILGQDLKQAKLLQL